MRREEHERDEKRSELGRGGKVEERRDREDEEEEGAEEEEDVVELQRRLAAAQQALEDLKAVDPVVLDVRELSAVMDWLVVASGTSSRHVKSLADNVMMKAKERGVRPLGVEGERVGEWVLVDFGDVVVHVMQPAARSFYDLERLWSVQAAQPESS